MKKHTIFLIVGAVLVAAGIPALGTGLGNGLPAFTAIGASELVCGAALVVLGLIRRGQHASRTRP